MEPGTLEGCPDFKAVDGSRVEILSTIQGKKFCRNKKYTYLYPKFRYEKNIHSNLRSGYGLCR